MCTSASIFCICFAFFDFLKNFPHLAATWQTRAHRIKRCLHQLMEAVQPERPLVNHHHHPLLARRQHNIQIKHNKSSKNLQHNEIKHKIAHQSLLSLGMYSWGILETSEMFEHLQCVSIAFSTSISCLHRTSVLSVQWEDQDRQDQDQDQGIRSQDQDRDQVRQYLIRMLYKKNSY